MGVQAASKTGRYDYARGSIPWGIARLSFPSFGELAAWNLDALVEIYWVGRLGPNGLAAMSLGFMVIMFLRSVGFGIRTAGQALVAQRIGAGDDEGASFAAGQMIALAILYSLPVMVLGYWLAPHFIRLLSASPELFGPGTSYLRAGFVVFIFIDGIWSLTNLVRGSGEPAYSLVAMVGSMAVTVVAIPVFIFGWGPIPPLGLAGAFWGHGAGKMFGCAVLLYFLSFRSRLRIRPMHLRPRLRLFRQYFFVGWPLAGQVLLERAANMVLLKMLSAFGPLALAAWGVGSRVSNMARLPGFALQTAARTMVGQSVGANRFDRAHKTAWTAIGISALLMLMISVGLFIAAELMARLFGMWGEAARIGALCLRYVSLGLGFEGCRRVVAGVFEGASITKPPMAVEVLARFGVLLPGAYLTGFALGLGVDGIWGTFAGSQIFGGLALFVWFLKGGWRRSRPIDRASDQRTGAGPCLESGKSGRMAM